MQVSEYLKDSKANPLSFLNKVFPSRQNRYYSLDMIAAAAAAAVEWNRSFEFELRSLNHEKLCVYSLIFKAFFV